MEKLSLEAMLNDGYSKKLALYFLKIIEAESKNTVYDKEFVKWAHGLGFSAESASVLCLTEDNKHRYLSDYDYYKVWPLNSWSRIWINDKLTLKYVLSDQRFAGFMPKYYYYSTENGLKALMDNPYTEGSADEFIQLLEDVSEIACKPCNGAQSAGFHKLSYFEKRFLIDNTEVSREDVIKFFMENVNYIFTEYLRPSADMSVFGSLIHTLRLIVLNETGNNPRIIGAYLRLPNQDAGAANYIFHDGTNNDLYNIYVGIDIDNGKFGKAVKAYPDRIVEIDKHPDTGALIKGGIEDYEQLKQLVLSASRWMNNVEFIGFDIGVTENGFKCMEINSLPGHMTPQIFMPYYDDENVKNYFLHKLKKIDSLTEQQKIARNRIIR